MGGRLHGSANAIMKYGDHNIRQNMDVIRNDTQTQILCFITYLMYIFLCSSVYTLPVESRLIFLPPDKFGAANGTVPVLFRFLYNVWLPYFVS